MQETVSGLVLRVRNTGENDRLLTLLVPGRGRMAVLVKGARSTHNRLGELTQPYVYGDFQIRSKNGYHWLSDGSVTESFFGLHADLNKMLLAAYLADVAWEISGEGEPADDLLRMTLNAFYALSGSLKPAALVKGVYEFRAAGLAGYLPELERCALCGAWDSHDMVLDVLGGRLLCPACRDRLTLRRMREEARPGRNTTGLQDEAERVLYYTVHASVAAAIRYALSAPIERMLAFELKDTLDLAQFSEAGERYLHNHLERGFESLELYHTMQEDSISLRKHLGDVGSSGM